MFNKQNWEKMADCSQLILLLTLDMEENDLDENETELNESDAECYAEAMADMFDESLHENQEVHEQVHENQEVHEHRNPIKCEFCIQRFRSQLELEEHLIEFHNGTYPYECTICEKGFFDPIGFAKI